MTGFIGQDLLIFWRTRRQDLLDPGKLLRSPILLSCLLSSYGIFFAITLTNAADLESR